MPVGTMKTEDKYRGLVRKAEVKRQTEILGCRWEDNIKTYHREIG
jgi:hypothetical protein